MNIFTNISTSKTSLQLLLLSGIALAALAFFFFQTTGAASGLSQVAELGVAELSPRGEEGGYAMPASGSSSEWQRGCAIQMTSGGETKRVVVTGGGTQEVDWVITPGQAFSGWFTSLWPANQTDPYSYFQQSARPIVPGVQYKMRAQGTWIGAAYGSGRGASTDSGFLGDKTLQYGTYGIRSNNCSVIIRVVPDRPVATLTITPTNQVFFNNTYTVRWDTSKADQVILKKGDVEVPITATSGSLPSQRALQSEIGRDITWTVVARDTTTGESATASDAVRVVGQCNDGPDNADPEDVLADNLDPGCWTNPNNPNSFTSTDPNESNTPYPCNNGRDDDGDGRIDYNGYKGTAKDPHCTSPTDPSEQPQCDNDNKDDDGDRLGDEADPGCHTDNDPNDGDDTHDKNDDNESGFNPGGNPLPKPTFTVNEGTDPVTVRAGDMIRVKWNDGDYQKFPGAACALAPAARFPGANSVNGNKSFTERTPAKTIFKYICTAPAGLYGPAAAEMKIEIPVEVLPQIFES